MGVVRRVAASPPRRARLLAALPALLLAAPAVALDPSLAPTQYTHRAWLADGSEGALPQNSVFSVLQARDGYLWVATQEGLARFDGVRFEVFNSRNTPAIRHNDVWRLLEDHEGALWIATRGGGLTRYRDGAFTNFSRAQGLSNDSVQTLWEDRQGALWIGTRGGGLNRLKDGKFTVFTAKDGLSSDTVYALLGSRDGALWIGTDGGGLSRFKDGKFTAITTKQGLSNDTVYALLEDRDGALWVGTGGGLDRIAGGRITAFRERDGLSNDNIRALFQDRDGSLWIGTDGGGLDRYAGGRFTAITTKQGLSNDSIGALYEDAEGSLWIGTDAGGLNRLRDNKFVTWSAAEGLSNDNARAVMETRDGALWIGTFGGLNRFKDGRFTRFTTKDGLSSDVVLSLAESRNGDLWAGTLGGGLDRLHDGRVTRYGKAQGLSHETVLSLLEDRDGTLWAGTRSGGLNRLENGRFRAYTTADGLPANDVRVITQAHDGSLWIGTLGGGLTHYRDGVFSTLGKAQGLSNDLVLAIHEDDAGVLWIGTFGGGLNRYKDGKFTAYTTKEGLFDDTVFQILEDDRGNLWMSSNHGVARVAKRDLDDFAAGRIATVPYAAYGHGDGMKSAECNGAHQPSGWKTRDGRLWFATIAGVTAVDPAHLAINGLPPPVVIEQFRVNGADVPVAEEIALPPGRTQLDVRYTALSFIAPERMRFRYRLEGFDEGWVEAGTQRTARYTNLPPGRYRFRVIASNNDGVWNENGAAQSFYLKPFFWQRRAFYVVDGLALALAVALVVGITRRRMRQMQVRERELLRLMDERRQAEEALREANRSLELRVAELSRFPGPRRVPPATPPPPEDKPEAMASLVRDFNNLMDQLAQRDHELQRARDALAGEVRDKTRANRELEEALRRLQETQAQLVQSEKLASLGALVAGITHEINTPVGIGVTAASSLQDAAEVLQRHHAEGRLTRADFERFVSLARESTRILLANLQRASDLIRGFKQIAVDQASGERRRFALKAYVDEVLLSLAPRLVRTPHSVAVEIPEDLTVDSYPGALAQILTNLVGNALQHGFAPGRQGRIVIAAREDGGDVALRFSDDGAGIAREHLTRVFDPFFTTRRGEGGSGLGLHIVYNLVTQRLGGSISVSSEPGAGARFDIRFPIKARQQSAA